MSDAKNIAVTFNQEFRPGYPFISHTNYVSKPHPTVPGRTRVEAVPIPMDAGPEWTAAGIRMTEACEVLAKEVEAFEKSDLAVSYRKTKKQEVRGIITGLTSDEQKVRDDYFVSHNAFVDRYKEARDLCAFSEDDVIHVCPDLAKILNNAGVVGERKPPQRVTVSNQPGREVTRQPL